MSALDLKRRDKAKASFKAHGFNGPDDARTYLSHLSATKGGGIGEHVASGNVGRATEALRAGKHDVPEMHQIDATMKPLPDGLDLYRSVPASKFGKVDPKSLEGHLVSDAGYFPTTVAPQKSAPGSVQLHIEAPAGTHAAVDPDSGQVVLDHGTQLAVDSVDVGPDGSARMNLIALPDQGGATPSETPPTAGGGDSLAPGGATGGAAELPESARPFYAPGADPGALADLVTSQGVAERHQLGGGQMATTERVVLDDGTEVFFKENGEWGGRDPRISTDAEQLAARVAEVLGAPVPSVYRNGDHTLMTDWTPGRTADEIYNDPNSAPGGDPDAYLNPLIDSGAGRRLGLLDMLTANPDRHDGNWMVTNNGQIVGIDHGLAWFTVTDEDDADPFLPTALRGPFVRGFTSGDSTLMTPGDVQEIRKRLESLRPEFEHLGRGEWLDHSIATLDRIGANANGTRSIFDD